MVRNKVTSILPCDTVERIIALGTTGEGIRARFKGNGREYLLDLFLHKVAFDEQMVLGQWPVTEVLIPGQDFAFLLERKADNIVVVKRPIIEDVEPEETEPFRERAKHDVGYNFHCFTTQLCSRVVKTFTEIFLVLMNLTPHSRS
jgi:hypothetical protein